MSQELNGLNGRPKARIVTAPPGPVPGLVPGRQTPSYLTSADSWLPQLGAVSRLGLLADQLSLVMEGVYACARAPGATGPIRHARSVVESLFDVS
jgi:hypothetical protein